MSAGTLRIALVGNPNCGKTALFNQITGGRQKVANYAGVTVERKEGRFVAPSGRVLQLLDLPGAYSLTANSPDEQITRDVCAGNYPGEAPPDLIVCVADATNLRLHLRFVLEVQRPTIQRVVQRRRGARHVHAGGQQLTHLGVQVGMRLLCRRRGDHRRQLAVDPLDQRLRAAAPDCHRFYHR
jgi:ribosome-interacting GTPase 1